MSTKSNPFVPGAAKMAPQVEGGLHPAVAVGVYDIGHRMDIRYGKVKREYVLVFELPAAEPIVVDGQSLPRTLSNTYTASMGPKSNLRPLLENWRGKKFTEEEAASYDVSRILGVRGQINVVHVDRNGKTYANIASILPAPKGSTFTATTNPVLWSVASLESAAELEQLDIPPWVKKKIKESNEYKALSGGSGNQPDAPAADADDAPW